MCVGLLPRKLKIAFIDPHQTGFVGKGSDHLQLIKFWPSRAPGKGSAVGRKLLALPYYSQRAVFASPLSACFISVVTTTYVILTLRYRFAGISWKMAVK